MVEAEEIERFPDTQVDRMATPQEIHAPELPKPQTEIKKLSGRKEPVAKVAGKSLLPFSRVQKIIRADKEISIIAKDATFLISLATEEFIKRLADASRRVAEREKRTTVQHKDIATIVRKADEFLFLEEIIPWLSTEPPVKRRPQGDVAGKKELIASSKQSEADVIEQEDIIMNEDGTMSL